MPQVNIGLDVFAIIVTLIVFFSFLSERIKKENKSNSFLFLMIAIVVALAADVVGWICEGHTDLSLLTVIGNTVASCAGYLSIFFFIMYLRENLYKGNVAAKAIVVMVAVFCVACMIMVSVTSYHGNAFHVDGEGHYVHGEDHLLTMTHLIFPLMAFFTILLMVIFAKNVSVKNRCLYFVYAAVPTVGVIVDYSVYGWSFTYIGLAISTLIIYTGIYLEKRRLIQEQRTAIMMSQINPHFMYNTLTTIASMCDIDPKKAKNLTVDFSSFLRQNLDTLTSTELIPFEQELRHIGCYLKIEKARFGDKIEVVYAIDCKDFYVPALTVQPLVENAVKHGITKKSGGGTVRISTYKTQRHYVIEIKDSGVGFESEDFLNGKVERVGISNVRNRLKDMCSGSLEIKSKKDVGTRVTVKIPNKDKYRVKVKE